MGYEQKIIKKQYLGKSILLTSMLLLPVSVLATVTPINYDYVEAGFYSGRYQYEGHDSNNVSTLDLSFSNQTQLNILLLGDYSARFIHPDHMTVRLDTLMAGAGYVFTLMPKLDLVVSYHAGIAKWDVSDKEHNKPILSSISESETKFIQGIRGQFNYALTDKWLLELQGQLNRSDLFNEDIYKLSFDYFITPTFSMALLGSHRSTSKVNTNEGGIRLRLKY